MGFNFSYLIYSKNIKQNLRRQLQAIKAIISIYKIIEIKYVKKRYYNVWKFLCKWALGLTHYTIHTICQIINIFSKTCLFKIKMKTKINWKLAFEIKLGQQIFKKVIGQWKMRKKNFQEKL
jgi:hypothetical protein